MRTTLLGAVSLLGALSPLALTACSKPAETTVAPAPGVPAAATPAAPAAATASTPGMDAAAMAAVAASDAGPLALTPDNHMFHVLQGTKEEKVVLPATGGVWTPDKPSSDLYSLADSTKTKLADGTEVVVFRFLMQKPGNATVVFTRPASSAADKAGETRTVMFMIH